jgi:hypothetical protein
MPETESAARHSSSEKGSWLCGLNVLSMSNNTGNDNGCPNRTTTNVNSTIVGGPDDGQPINWVLIVSFHSILLWEMVS